MKYFSFAEFSRSATAAEKGIDNTIPFAAKVNIERLVRLILDPVRMAWGAPLYVTSGYRCVRLNVEVGGAKKSYHKCYDDHAAADITTGSRDGNIELYNAIKDSSLPYLELICEGDGAWLHVAI